MRPLIHTRTDALLQLFAGDAALAVVGDRLVDPHGQRVATARIHRFAAQFLCHVGEPARQHREDHFADVSGAKVVVVLGNVAQLGELLASLPGVAAMLNNERAGAAGVGLQIPRVGLHLGLAVLVVAFHFVQAVVDVAPDAREFAGQVDRWPDDCAPSAVEAEEGAAGQLDP